MKIDKHHKLITKISRKQYRGFLKEIIRFLNIDVFRFFSNLQRLSSRKKWDQFHILFRNINSHIESTFSFRLSCNMENSEMSERRTLCMNYQENQIKSKFPCYFNLLSYLFSWNHVEIDIQLFFPSRIVEFKSVSNKGRNASVSIYLVWSIYLLSLFISNIFLFSIVVWLLKFLEKIWNKSQITFIIWFYIVDVWLSMFDFLIIYIVIRYNLFSH